MWLRLAAACVEMLRGDLDAAAGRIEGAAALGRRIHEPEAALVRMAQRLELVRARGEPEELITFTEEAKLAWAGAPILANSLGAGFLARVGDLPGARRHVATVVDLGGWCTDRSYAWTGTVRELSVAAIALGDEGLCSQLLADVLPVAATCGVSGAVVSFSGSHAHIAASLSAALGAESGPLFAQARDVYTRLGAVGWLADLDGQQARWSVPVTPSN